MGLRAAIKRIYNKLKKRIAKFRSKRKIKKEYYNTLEYWAEEEAAPFIKNRRKLAKTLYDSLDPLVQKKVKDVVRILEGTKTSEIDFAQILELVFSPYFGEFVDYYELARGLKHRSRFSEELQDSPVTKIASSLIMSLILDDIAARTPPKEIARKGAKSILTVWLAMSPFFLKDHFKPIAKDIISYSKKSGAEKELKQAARAYLKNLKHIK